MSPHYPTAITLSLRIERTPSRRLWVARVEELEMAAVGLTSADALYYLGQNLSALAQSCQTERKDVFDLITVQGD